MHEYSSSFPDRKHITCKMMKADREHFKLKVWKKLIELNLIKLSERDWYKTGVCILYQTVADIGKFYLNNIYIDQFFMCHRIKRIINVNSPLKMGQCRQTLV